VADVAKQAWLLVIVPLLSIFFLKDGRAFSQVLLDLVQSRPQRELLQGVLSDLNQMLAHFIRAQLTLAALTLVIYSAVLGMMGMPYALVLGTLGGLLEFIPVVGPLVAAVVIVGVALLMSYPHWLGLVIFSGHVAADSGLRNLTAHHGPQHGIAPAGGNFRRDGGWRGCGYSWHFSFDSGNGKPAYRLPALAPVRGETQVRSARRVRDWRAGWCQEVERQSAISS